MEEEAPNPLALEGDLAVEEEERKRWMRVWDWLVYFLRYLLHSVDEEEPWYRRALKLAFSRYLRRGFHRLRIHRHLCLSRRRTIRLLLVERDLGGRLDRWVEWLGVPGRVDSWPE